jgi:hypothetical protein
MPSARVAKACVAWLLQMMHLLTLMWRQKLPGSWQHYPLIGLQMTETQLAVSAAALQKPDVSLESLNQPRQPGAAQGRDMLVSRAIHVDQHLCQQLNRRFDAIMHIL